MDDNLDSADGKLSAHEAYCARQCLARDHAALFPTGIAMARWRSGVSSLQTGQPPLRAAWYASLGRKHQAWLDRGGFTQYEQQPPWRTPDMWHPPQAPVQAHEAGAPEQSISQQSDRDDRDGDTRQCGACN